MRPDQRERLEILRDRLLDTALLDADPSNWIGSGKVAVDMTQKERGDAYWCRKLAAASIALLTKVNNLVVTHTATTAGTGKCEDELDEEVAQAERQAMALMERASKGANVH